MPEDKHTMIQCRVAMTPDGATVYHPETGEAIVIRADQYFYTGRVVAAVAVGIATTGFSLSELRFFQALRNHVPAKPVDRAAYINSLPVTTFARRRR